MEVAATTGWDASARCLAALLPRIRLPGERRPTSTPESPSRRLASRNAPMASGSHVEGRIAFLKAELKITEHMPQWNAFATSCGKMLAG